MIGIGNYDDGVELNLIGVPRDYCNVKYTFNYKRGYHIIYKMMKIQVVQEKK